jgi:hypothetical protein
MVEEASTWVDVEIAVREWARDFVLSADRRVFFSAHDDTTVPQIVVQRIAGRDESCLIQFDVWAPNKLTAVQVSTELATALDALARFSHEGVLLHGADVQNVRWQPDAEDNMPRYIIDAILTASSNGLS